MNGPTHSNKAVFWPRVILWSFLLSTVLFPSVYQPFLDYLWDFLYHNAFYNLSTYETILTVVSYGVLEPWYTREFARNPELRVDVRDHQLYQPPIQHIDDTNPAERNTKNNKEKTTSRPRLPKMKRPSRRLGEIFIYAAPLLLMDLTMIKKFANVPLNDIRVSGGYPPLPQLDANISQTFAPGALLNTNHTASTSPDQGRISSTFLLPTLHNITHSPLQLHRALPPPAPTSRLLTLQLLTSLILYDALFFILHLSLHKLPPLAKLHVPHHTHAEIHPQITNALSVPERLSLVLLANFSLNIIRSHVFTRTIFVPVFVNLLIQVHSGMDLVWGYEKFLPRGWAGGGREHARHHRTGQGNLAPFFSWCDRGLEWVQGWRGEGGGDTAGGNLGRNKKRVVKNA